MGVFLRHRYICGLKVLLKVCKGGGDWPLLPRQKSYCSHDKTPVFCWNTTKAVAHCIGSEERKVFQLPYLNPGWISVVFLIHHSTSQEFSDRLKMLSRIKPLFLIAAGHPQSGVSAVVKLQVSDGKPLAFYCAVCKILFV